MTDAAPKLPVDAAALSAARAQRPDGEIDLGFSLGERDGSDRPTLLTRRYRRGNSHVSNRMETGLGDQPYYYVLSSGGGLTEGERYTAAYEVAADAHAVVTTNAGTYVLKCPHGRLTSQDVRIHVGQGAAFEFYQDDIIPFATAVFRLGCRVDLEPGAKLVLSEGISKGWTQDGSGFGFADLGLCTQIYRSGRLVHKDYQLLVPGTDPMGSLGYFEGYEVFRQVTVMDEVADNDMVDALRDALAPVQEVLGRADAIWGVSLLGGGGMTLRVLAQGHNQAAQVVDAFVKAYREDICGWQPLHLRKSSEQGR